MPALHSIMEFASVHQYLIYLVLFPLALFEGPVLALAVGFLVKLGYLEVFAAYTVMVAGDFFPDSFYYYIGRLAHTNGWVERLSERFTSKARFILDNRSTLDKLWTNHGKKMMLFSKQAYGLSTALLISAGLVNMSYRRFLAYAFPITLIQYIVFMTIGYSLGYSYNLAAGYIHYAGWIVAAGVVIFITLYIMIQKRARKALMDMEKTSAEEKNL
jgi:membrane protein DedA with SNARE-associated domain